MTGNTSLLNIKPNLRLSAHQLVEDVPLVDVDGDERLILGPLISAQIPGRHINQLIEEVEELLIGRLHDLSTNQIGDSEGEGVGMIIKDTFPLCSRFQNKSTFLSDLL